MYAPYIDAGIENEDSNYDESFWEILEIIEGTSQVQQEIIASFGLRRYYIK